MELLTGTYLFYSFSSIYFLTLFLLIYLQNRKQMFEIQKPKKDSSLSIVIPCYNEGDSIGETIQRLLNSDYKNLKKIIVVDDCSKDNSYEIIKKIAGKNPRVFACQTPKNTGCAAGAKNFGAKFVNTELIGFSDGDSFPEKDAISNMVGFFNDKKVGAVTSRVLVRNRETFIGQLQSIEYKVIAFTRKLLGFIDGIYVTNGPLSIYPKKIFDEVHGFDDKNLTEDIELTWHIVSKGYLVHMSLSSLIYTIAPSNFKAWFKQRIRWNVGGLQTIKKYKNKWFKCGMLGSFILPFFSFSWMLAIFGILVLIYRIFRIAILRILSISYSTKVNVAILTLREINFSPNALLFFGITTLLMGLFFTLIALAYSKEKHFKKQGIFLIFNYTFIYLLLYPLILINSIYKYLRGYKSW